MGNLLYKVNTEPGNLSCTDRTGILKIVKLINMFNKPNSHSYS